MKVIVYISSGMVTGIKTDNPGIEVDVFDDDNYRETTDKDMIEEYDLLLDEYNELEYNIY